MMFFLKPTRNGDDIPADRYIALARELGIPCFCDAATTTPPASNVIDGVGEGFDLICYSGGKGLRGPYSAGLLLGRKDLIRFARRHSAPNDLSIGRGMKVSAEEYLGMLVAIETGLSIGDEADFSYKHERFANIVEQLADVPSVSTRVFVAKLLSWAARHWLTRCANIHRRLKFDCSFFLQAGFSFQLPLWKMGRT